MKEDKQDADRTDKPNGKQPMTVPVNLRPREKAGKPTRKRRRNRTSLVGNLLCIGGRTFNSKNTFFTDIEAVY